MIFSCSSYSYVLMSVTELKYLNTCSLIKLVVLSSSCKYTYSSLNLSPLLTNVFSLIVLFKQSLSYSTLKLTSIVVKLLSNS